MSTGTASRRPLMTKESYELCSSGPVQIHYVPESMNEPKRRAKIAIQTLTGWTPLFCSTAQCFTRVVCQSEVPLFVPETVDLFVKGKDIEIYVPANAVINDEEGAVITEKPRNGVDCPQVGIAVMYAADLSKFGEKIEVVITDGMKVFCGGASKVTVDGNSTVDLYKMQDN